MKRTRQEVAKFIQEFLDGTGGNRDWDDFTSIRITDDPYLENIRLTCGALRDDYPPIRPNEYCGPGGDKILRAFLEELK